MGKGPLTGWEDVLVSIYGSEWRRQRDQCVNEKEWLRRSSHFVNEVCKAWSLPVAASRTAFANQDPPKVLGTHKPSTPSLLDPCLHSGAQEVFEWQYGEKCFAFHVDCKALQEILCGHARLEGDFFLPIIRRITNNLLCMCTFLTCEC